MIEGITEEYMYLKKLFQNPYVYYVGTSRGCACDFELAYDQHNDWDVTNIIPLQRFYNIFRRIYGTYESWAAGHRENVKKHIAQRMGFVKQTHDLIGIIEAEIGNGNVPELVCINGFEDINALEHEIIDTKQVDIRTKFPPGLGADWVYEKNVLSATDCEEHSITGQTLSKRYSG